MLTIERLEEVVKLCSKLIIETPDRHHGVVLVPLWLTLKIFDTLCHISIINFEM